MIFVSNCSRTSGATSTTQLRVADARRTGIVLSVDGTLVSKVDDVEEYDMYGTTANDGEARRQAAKHNSR